MSKTELIEQARKFITPKPIAPVEQKPYIAELMADFAEQAVKEERRRIAENVSVPLSLEPGLDVLHMLAAYLRKEFAAEIAGTTDPE